MKKVILDGKQITLQKEIHSIFKKELNFPEYYGCNLDALWDMLSVYDNKVTVEIINLNSFSHEMKEYIKKLSNLLKDAEEENKNIKYNIT